MNDTEQYTGPPGPFYTLNAYWVKFVLPLPEVTGQKFQDPISEKILTKVKAQGKQQKISWAG